MTDINSDQRQIPSPGRLSFSIRASALVFILTTAIVFCCLLTLTSYTYRFAIDQREQVSDWHVAQLRAAEDLRYLYLQYTQSWNNILLRGHEQLHYHKQLSRFYALERQIRTGIQALERELGHDTPSMNALQAFDQEYYQAGRLYRRGLRTFNEDISEPQFAADAMIRDAGIDAVHRINEFIEALEVSRHDRHQQITSEMESFENSIVLLVLLLIAAFLAAVYYLTDFFIIAPINKGISLADAISRGNLDNSSGNEHAASEINQLLQSLHRMQENISRAHQELTTAKEQAEQSNAAKTAFLSRMSHELRTPLHAILGFGQILQLQAEPLSERQQNNVEKILKAGNHLLDLINEVLDLARIDNNKMEISIENLDLAEYVAQCVNMTIPQAQERNVTLVNNIAPELQYVVRADPLRFKQALINLISNAIKYGFEHGTVILECEKTADSSLRIKVIDNGPGIPVEKQPLLFKPFERLDEKRVVEGTGIGLALTKKLVELMNGKTGAESVPGKGSTFWIMLPLSSTDYPYHRIAGNAADRFRERQTRRKQR